MIKCSILKLALSFSEVCLLRRRQAFFLSFFSYVSHNLLVIKEVFIEYLLVMYRGLFWMLVIILVNKANLKSGRKDSFVSLFFTSYYEHFSFY